MGGQTMREIFTLIEFLNLEFSIVNERKALMSFLLSRRRRFVYGDNPKRLVREKLKVLSSI